MAKLINEVRALESFRCSDFDVYSAYGEIIDNSLQANASWIKIKIEKDHLQQRGRPYYKIKEIAFSDNGQGMNRETINNCLAMGYSSRYNDRSGIGRFGVGMTLASINQCKRVEVYSREDSGKWFWTYADLDEIVKGEMLEIPEAKTVDLPQRFQDIASDDSGTIVIWSKYDRQPETAERIEEEMKVWFGRTFRYFIWDGVQIFVNRDEVKAIDPLYVKTDKTKFPNDPKAEELKTPIVFSWETMRNEDEKDVIPTNSDVTIRMSILPKEFRKDQGSGGSSEAKKRYIDRNEGVSIVRNKREVFYGTIPYYSPQFSEIDRWWGCEISFNAVLDNAFTVKNIKRGALPTPELRQKIKEEIEEIRKKYKEQITEHWRKKTDEDLNTNNKENPHATAMNVIKGTPIPQNPKTTSNDTTEIPGILQPINTEDYPITIVEGDWEGPNFFTKRYQGGQIVLAYNKRHQFYEELKKIKTEINEIKGEDNLLYRDLITLINLVLSSFSKAEAMLDGMSESAPDIFAENIRNNWGLYLKQFLSTWRKKKNILSKDE